MIDNVASAENRDKVYGQCRIDESIARINGDYKSETEIDLTCRKMQADLEKSLSIKKY